MANEAQMIVTSLGDVSTITKTVWSERLHYEAINKMQWIKLAGPEGSGMPFIVKSELVNEEGDTVKIRRFKAMTGAAQTGRLRGTEEKLVPQVLAITPTLKRIATAEVALVPTQTGINYKELVVRQLGERMAQITDESVWAVAQATAAAGLSGVAPTRLWAHGATGYADIDAADIFSITELLKMRERLEENKATPVGGEDGYYVCLLHTRQAYDLSNDSKWREYQEHADVRGLENWLYQGGKPYPFIGDPKIFGYFEGVAVMKTSACPVANSSGSPVIVTACAVMMGQDALARGVGAYVTEEGEEYDGVRFLEQLDDYQNEHGTGAAYVFLDKILTSEYLVQCVSAAVLPT